MLMKMGFVFCVLVSIIQICGCAQKQNNCSLFNKMYISSMKSDTPHLVQLLNNVISQDSLCVNALLTRGDIFFDINNLSLAKQDYFKVLSLDSKNVYSLYQLGELFNVEEKYDSAILFFQKAIDLKSNGNFILDRTNENIDPQAKYDIEANEIMFARGLSFYYKRRLNDALNDFSYCIVHKYKLDKSYLYRAAILIELKSNLGAACSDLYEAKKNGSKEANMYIFKYCRK
jgi:lipoprotein NlpI